MNPRLSDLHPAWIAPTKDGFGFAELSTGHRPHVLWGIHFLCPVCFVRKGGPIGVHAIHCLSHDAPKDMEPLPGRWAIMGEMLDRLTLDAPTRGHRRRLPCLVQRRDAKAGRAMSCLWHGEYLRA